MTQNACRFRLSILLLVFLSSAGAAHAQEAGAKWFVRTDLQGLASTYSGTSERDSLQNFGLFVRADYLERGGFTLGYNRTVLGFKGRGVDDITQDNVFVSGRLQTTPDWAAGRLTWRLDGYAISNNDATGGTDDVTVVAPQLSYMNFAQTFYADLGFARSSYGDGSSTQQQLDVDQLTPTLGFGFNEQRDWLQLRAYLISPSAPERAQDQSDTAALEIKWMHWPMSPSFLGVDNYRVSILSGERIYAVDPDAGTVFNLVDLQTGGASVGAEWAPTEKNRILLIVGVESYENRVVGADYDSGYLYVNFTHNWN